MTRINVTKSFLPPIEEYITYIQKIWDNVYLTNQGPLLKELEKQLEQYLRVDNLQLVANGTLALQLALRAVDAIGGEVITTPFTFVATTSAILWEGCQPVYVDIDLDTLCIDAAKIEAAITDRTKAILGVHVFGAPCDVDAIAAIAKKHNLPVIYDAAHAFGVEVHGRSLLSYGDIATCSFHATKIFHTIEGGGVVVNNPDLVSRIDLLKKFGAEGDEQKMLGINAKMTEFNAAMGLATLPYMDHLISQRKGVTELYDRLLPPTLTRPVLDSGVSKRNYIYYPILFETEDKLLEAVRRLQQIEVYPRRYFYPSLNTLPYLKMKQTCSVSEDVARRILCLPLYAELGEPDVRRICDVLQ